MAERQILDFSEYQLWPFGGNYLEKRKFIELRKGGFLKVTKRNKIRKCTTKLKIRMYEVEWRINKRRKKQIIKQKNRNSEIVILGKKNKMKKKKSKKRKSR